MAIVQLDAVSFRYPVFQVANRSLKIAVMRQMAGGRIEGQNVLHVQALTDISFALEAGDRLGLVGRNGSGKSTLLRLLAGLAFPQQGKLSITGRVVPLIEKGMGIQAEMSGMDNIELPLRLLGATNREIEEARKEIPEFTGIGPFIDLPVRTYSEGMRARLMFAICTAIIGDVLVLDEWLGAGDMDFYQRAEARLTSMLEKTGVVVLASHSNELIRQVCNKVAWLDRGKLVMIGDPTQVLHAYANSGRGPVLATAAA